VEADGSGKPDDVGIAPLEQELSIHLERAHELGERAKRSNDQAQIEIDRAREIAERLRGQFRPDRP
jgi:hypothetical protein